MTSQLTWIFTAAALGWAAPPEPADLRPGQPAPAWSGLPGTDGKTHSLADLRGKQAVVVVFFANSCPDSLLYEDRFIALAKDYADKSVAVVLINVCLQPEDSLEEMTKRAGRKRYPFPYLLDKTQKIGLAYGAQKTPTVFVLDKSRTVAYRGALDDDFKPERVERRYAREALDAVRSGRRVATAETEPFGCDIDYQ
jgi:peroxiredoxin